VEGDGEAVGFVADALDEMQGGGVFGDSHGNGISWEKEFFLFFGEGGDFWGVAPGCFFERGNGGGKLAFSPSIRIRSGSCFFSAMSRR